MVDPRPFGAGACGTYSVSIMEFAAGQVVHETQYFAEPFSAPAWRRELAEPMPGRSIAEA